MKKLLYLFLGCMLLAGCRGNRFYLDKVEALWGVNYDSMQYYLLKVDSVSLTPDEWMDYHFYNMMASYSYLLSMEKQQLDSVICVLKQHYPKGHERAFRIRQWELVYYNDRLGRWKEGDSLMEDLKGYMQHKRDSSLWYYYKSHVKNALGEPDSALHYQKEAMKFRLWEDAYAYERQASVYRMNGQPDSAIAYYLKSMERDTTLSVISLNNQVLDLLVELKDSHKALEYLNKVRQRMKRADIPYYNLIKGDYWMEMHEPDSAMKHYRIATETGNGFIASEAYERMGMIAQTRQAGEDACRMYQKAQRVNNELYRSMESKRDTRDFESLKMKNQLTELKVERQRHVILILGLLLFILVLIGTFAFYLVHRKRVGERNRMMQENVMLKQREELGALREKEALLREKDARMREELFKRINVFEKLSDTEKEKHIQLSDMDWKEIQLMLDSGYDDFTKKLRIRFPMLSEKDINFCCLVKINMSIQSLTDIYCISKNSVSRRKLRLKEKMGIGEEATLDEFLSRFE